MGEALLLWDPQHNLQDSLARATKPGTASISLTDSATNHRTQKNAWRAVVQTTNLECLGNMLLCRN